MKERKGRALYDGPSISTGFPHLDSAGGGGRCIDQGLRHDALIGLAGTPKTVPGRHLFDQRGQDLAAALASAPEHYQERAELGLVKACATQIAALAGDGACVVGLGSDPGLARLLLGVLPNPTIYMPVDGAAQQLWGAAMQLQLDYPFLAVRPMVTDLETFETLPPDGPWSRGQLLFLLSDATFGAMDQLAAGRLMRRLAAMMPQSLLVLGVDLWKNAAVLEHSYCDSSGFASELNLNLLVRLNRELGATFDVNTFEHETVFNPVCNRVELHLRSRRRQVAVVDGMPIAFEKGETIRTACAYKYSIVQVHKLAQTAGFVPARAWIDPEHRFSLHVFQHRDAKAMQ